jgi:hypothetical protein
MVKAMAVAMAATTAMTAMVGGTDNNQQKRGLEETMAGATAMVTEIGRRWKWRR